MANTFRNELPVVYLILVQVLRERDFRKGVHLVKPPGAEMDMMQSCWLLSILRRESW